MQWQTRPKSRAPSSAPGSTPCSAPVCVQWFSREPVSVRDRRRNSGQVLGAVCAGAAVLGCRRDVFCRCPLRTTADLNAAPAIIACFGVTMRQLILYLVLFSTPFLSAQQYDIILEGGRVMDPDTGLDAVRN